MISILGFVPLLFSLKLFKYLESQMENDPEPLLSSHTKQKSFIWLRPTPEYKSD